MPRKQIAAGNWKMHKNLDEGIRLAQAIISGAPENDALVILATPYIHLSAVAKLIASSPDIQLAGQNCHQEDQGAYTGEISAAMLRSTGATYVVLGHSERREYFGEDDALLASKLDAALANDLLPIFCCGESLDIRESGKHVEHVSKQITNSLFHLDEEQMRRIVIAYEPIWAIGTGVTASPDQAQEMHHEIRRMLAEKYGADLANDISILYGGSVKPNNAEILFSQQDVDGGLVGGASLNAADFIEIIKACRQ